MRGTNGLVHMGSNRNRARIISGLVGIAYLLGMGSVSAAEYLVFRNSATRTNEVSRTNNIANLNLGQTDHAIPWVVSNGNRRASDYLRSGNEVTLSPPPEPVHPKIDGFIDAVQADGTIVDAVKDAVERMVLYYCIGKKGASLNIWTRIKAGAPLQADKVKAHATANDLVLP